MAGPVYDEIATTKDGRDITRGYVESLELLRPQDSVLWTQGGDYATYRELLRDDQVKPVWEQRRLAVVAEEWEVLPGGSSRRDKAAAQALREDLADLGWDRITDRMLYAIFFGYAVGECLYTRDWGRVRLTDIRVRRHDRFAFAPNGDLRLLTMRHPLGEDLPSQKFWTISVGSDNDDEPYGLALGHWLYWPVFFKRNNIRLWLYALDKYGSPTAVGTYPPSAQPEEKARLLATLEAIQRDSGIILPEGHKITLLEAMKYATTEHVALYDRLNAAISKVVVGQTMTTDDGSSQAQATVHWDVLRALAKADSDVICESFNRGPARWLTGWNFPGAAAPKVWRRFEEPADLKGRSEIEKNVYAVGYRPKLQTIREEYGGEWEPVNAAGPPDTSPPAFAGETSEAGDADPVDQLSDQLEEAARPLMDQLLEPVQELLARANSLEEFRDGLLDAYAPQPIGELGTLLQKALTVAELSGRWKVDRGE